MLKKLVFCTLISVNLMDAKVHPKNIAKKVHKVLTVTGEIVLVSAITGGYLYLRARQ